MTAPAASAIAIPDSISVNPSASPRQQRAADHDVDFRALIVEPQLLGEREGVGPDLDGLREPAREHEKAALARQRNSALPGGRSVANRLEGDRHVAIGLRPVASVPREACERGRGLCLSLCVPGPAKRVERLYREVRPTCPAEHCL